MSLSFHVERVLILQKCESHRGVIRANVDFQIEIVPADGIRLPFSESGDFGTSPFGSFLVKAISSTAYKRTTVVP
jgi:hypothetical protein